MDLESLHTVTYFARPCRHALREHRSDGHVAALVAPGLGGCEAHVVAAATAGIPAAVLRDSRGWSEAQWDTAGARLAQRGILHTDGTASDQGRALRTHVEASTDALAESAYASLTDGECKALHAALSPCAGGIQASGLPPFPNPMGSPRQ